MPIYILRFQNQILKNKNIFSVASSLYYCVTEEIVPTNPSHSSAF